MNSTVIFLIYLVIIYLGCLYAMYSINNKITRFISLYILSDIPFLQLSHDENFHSIENKFDLKKYRFSLIFIPFGKFKLYFFTYKFNSGFKWFKSLSIDSIYARRKNNMKIEMVKKYKLVKKDNDFLQIIKEDTKLYQSSINTARTKGTFYITLLAAILSIIFTQIPIIKTTIGSFSPILLIITGYLILIFTNFLILNLQFISIRTIYRETFEDFIDKIGYDKFLYYYNNMHWIKLDSQVLVSYIKNIEIYIIKVIVISFILLILYIFL